MNIINIHQQWLFFFFLLSIQKHIRDKQTKQNTWPEPNPGSKQIWIRNLWLRSVILNPAKEIYFRCVPCYDIWTLDRLVGWLTSFGILLDVAQGKVCAVGSGTPQLCLRTVFQSQKH